jgi:Domain of unknown function (DUF397)
MVPQPPTFTWRKSSYSSNTSNCVEVTLTGDGALMRDTKARHAGHVTVPAVAWLAFLDTATR